MPDNTVNDWLNSTVTVKQILVTAAVYILLTAITKR